MYRAIIHITNHTYTYLKPHWQSTAPFASHYRLPQASTFTIESEEIYLNELFINTRRSTLFTSDDKSIVFIMTSTMADREHIRIHTIVFRPKALLLLSLMLASLYSSYYIWNFLFFFWKYYLWLLKLSLFIGYIWGVHSFIYNKVYFKCNIQKYNYFKLSAWFHETFSYVYD